MDIQHAESQGETLVETSSLTSIIIHQYDFIGDVRPPVDLAELQNFISKVAKIGLEFKYNGKTRAHPSLPPITKTFSSPPTTGISLDELLLLWQEIAMTSTNFASPNFMGFPDSGNALPALGAAILIPFLNQNLANQDICGPSASFVEMEVVHWLRSVLGYQVRDTYLSVKDIGGTITLGGCLSNTIALMAARERLFPGCCANGLPVPANRICVLVPEIIEHYSTRSGLAWLSLGEQNVVRVPVDKYFRLRRDELVRCIDNERAKDRFIMACVLYAGDSRSMGIDDIDSVADILHSKGIWLHVDACHGSQLAFSNKYRHKLKGIEKADSITIDPHKVLCIPYTCSLVLFREPISLSRIATSSDLILKTQWSLGQITPCIGSKAFDALKLWSTLKYFGISGIERMIDQRLEMTKRIQDEIRERDDLVLLNDTDINSCIFLFLPNECQRGKLSVPDTEKINAINKSIKAQLTADGEFYLHGFPMKRFPHIILPELAIYVLRIINGNPLTTIEHVQKLLSRVVTLGHQILDSNGYKIIPRDLNFSQLAVARSLASRLARLFGDVRYSALVYGSCTSSHSCLLSDVDLMVFAPDEFCTTQNVRSVCNIFENTMTDEGVLKDVEIPYERKLLIPITFASQSAAVVGGFIRSGQFPTLRRTAEYLGSDEMLHRLVFNVLTIPTIELSNLPIGLSEMRKAAEQALTHSLTDVRGSSFENGDEFALAALTDGVRAGEEFLGYKDRPEVVEHLRRMFTSGPRIPQPDLTGVLPPCVLFINGFPGVGKLTIARRIHKLVPHSLLIDNHLLIDPAEAIEPNRTREHYILRRAIRQAAFEGLKTVQEKSAIFVMTSCTADNPADREVFSEFVDIARVRCIPFISVNIDCEPLINMDRMIRPERYTGKTKLTDGRVLGELRSRNVILDPRKCGRDTEGVKVYHMNLDTTERSVEASANAIIRFMLEAS
jgi:L-2,4-diaminobutyrate decarboxylase